MPQATETIQRIVGFLATIGLGARYRELEIGTVIPGVTVERGTMLVDVDKLLSPGDLLHEAGHLALLTPGQRAAVSRDFGADGGYVMGAIAWSWAAACELDLDPAVVFHAQGYRGASDALIDNFASGRYIGVPMLEWLGLTAQGEHANTLRVDPYPAMIRWIV